MLTATEELDQLQKFAKIGETFGNNDLEHLNAPMGAYNYIRMADIISKHFLQNVEDPTNEPFLDWGAGYGQVSWLLKNRDINVTGYNVEERQNVEAIPELAGLKMLCDSDPVKMPFPDESFAGVSSCGVLEHVADPEGSLREIYRILKSGGYFYLLMLPQQTSWVEKLSEVRGISVHPVRYTVGGTRKILNQTGFEVESQWKFNLVPKNLTGIPHRAKRLYGKLYPVLYPLDKGLSMIPGLNLLSGVIECIARKI